MKPVVAKIFVLIPYIYYIQVSQGEWVRMTHACLTFCFLLQTDMRKTILYTLCDKSNLTSYEIIVNGLSNDSGDLLHSLKQGKEDFKSLKVSDSKTISKAKLEEISSDSYHDVVPNSCISWETTTMNINNTVRAIKEIFVNGNGSMGRFLVILGDTDNIMKGNFDTWLLTAEHGHVQMHVYP